MKVIIALWVRSFLQLLVGVLITLGVTQPEALAFSTSAEPVIVAIIVHAGTLLWSWAEKNRILSKLPIYRR